MAKGSVVLQSHITKLRGLAKLVKNSTPQIVTAVEKVISAQVARGEEPDGTKWKLRKAGGRPLKNAAAAVKVSAVQNVILALITGHHAKHHLGAVKGKVRRRILPSSKLPNPYEKAIRELLARNFRRAMR